MKDLGRIGFSEDQATLLEVATDFCQRRAPVATVRRLMEDELGHDPAVWTEPTAAPGLASPRSFPWSSRWGGG
jgi:acyl-CoA dehydrogenase